ncbi:MAG: hypothetical protein RLZZ292_3927 [Bacteroidota bacterium]|jgi:glycosyltransferase involved in cell wall biosynthesis
MITTLNIIVPCYNPPDAWAEHLCRQYQAFVQGAVTPIVQLILVNDGSAKGISSADWTYLTTQIPTIQVVNYSENRGKGYALRQGVAASKADLYIFTDIDFPYTLASMWAVERALQERGNIAAGYRNRTYYEHVPAWRKALSWAFRGFIKALSIPVTDTQCGLKGFDNLGKSIFLQTTIDRFLFDLEFLSLAGKNKFAHTYSVDVELNEGVVFSRMGWRVVASELRNLVRIVLPNLFGKR